MTTSYPVDKIAIIKAQLQKLDAAELDQLRDVYKYRSVRWLARSTGQWNIFAGALTLWLGWIGLPYSVLHLVQAIIGALTLLVSIWAVVKPSRQAVRIFAWLFLLSGIWNLFLVPQNNFDGASLVIGLFGLAQLWWAYQYYRRYRMEEESSLTEVSSALAQTYDDIWNAIDKSDLQIDSDFVEFQIGANRWRGWLLNDLAVFALKRRKVLYLGHENNIAFEPHVSKLGKKKRFYITTRFDQVASQGFIRRPSFDRYAEWKLRNHPGASPDDFQLNGTGKRNWLPFPYLHPLIRIPVLIALAVILFYAIFLIIIFIQYS